MSVTSYACGICGAAFGCDGAAFAGHMHALHQIDMATGCVMMSREEYDALESRADRAESRVRALEAALDRHLAFARRVRRGACYQSYCSGRGCIAQVAGELLAAAPGAAGPRAGVEDG